MGLPAKTGKPVGNDFREGKKTLLLLHAYQKSTAGEKQFLEDYLGKEVSDTLDRVQSIIARTGALEAAKEEINKHLLNAQKALNSLKGNVLVIGQLRGLGTYLGNRDV
jgi:geranylgeranyl diphosphate synthase type I